MYLTLKSSYLQQTQGPWKVLSIAWIILTIEVIFGFQNSQGLFPQPFSFLVLSGEKKRTMARNGLKIDYLGILLLFFPAIKFQAGHI